MYRSMRRHPLIQRRKCGYGWPSPGGAAPKARTERGFTLVEVCLAVALSALLLTIVYGTYFSINRSIDATSEDQDALDTGRILSELIKRDIRAINPVRYPFTAKNNVINGRTCGQMEFVTTALKETDPLRLRRVGYALINTDKGENIFMRTESTNLSKPLDNTANAFEVSRIVSGFQIEFFDGTGWVQDWDSTIAKTLPQQIRITIDVSDAKGRNKRFTAEESIQSAIQ